MAKALSPKHARFVKEYLKDHNGKQAAIRAGYARRSAESQASRLLRNRKVATALATGEKRISEKLDLSAERIKAEIGSMAMADRSRIADKDKLKALELLGRTEGMFKDRNILEDPDGKPVTFTLNIGTPVES